MASTPTIECIGFAECDPLLDWNGVCEALRDGHRHPRAKVADQTLSRDGDRLLSRVAWIDGLGCAVKTASIFPGNSERDLPTVNGSCALFDDQTGFCVAMIDFHLVTKWKTAADSLLAAKLLARKDCQRILILGAGRVAESMIDAYRHQFTQAHFRIWNRNPARAASLISRLAPHCDIRLAEMLDTEVANADIVCAATMSEQPLIRGHLLRPGTHVDLIGAFTAEMREADDAALKRARIFVDSRATTLHHIGELRDPIARHVIGEQDILGDFYDIGSHSFARQSSSEITLFKNGGGAHLDLMTARYILKRWQSGKVAAVSAQSIRTIC